MNKKIKKLELGALIPSVLILTAIIIISIIFAAEVGGHIVISLSISAILASLSIIGLEIISFTNKNYQFKMGVRISKIGLFLTNLVLLIVNAIIMIDFRPPFYYIRDLGISLSVFTALFVGTLPLSIILIILYQKEQSPLISEVEKINTKENNKNKSSLISFIEIPLEELTERRNKLNKSLSEIKLLIALPELNVSEITQLSLKGNKLEKEIAELNKIIEIKEKVSNN